MKKFAKTILLLAIVLLAGCAKATDTRFPLTVGELTIDHAPKRVVSLSPAITEQLFVLGYGGRIAAAVEADSPLSGVRELVSCGSFFAPDADVILSAAPDLVLSSGQLPRYLADALAEQKIPLLVLSHPGDEQEAVEQLSLLCAVFEGTQRAENKKNQLIYLQQTLSDAVTSGSSGAQLALGNNSPPTALWLLRYPDVAAGGGTQEDKLLSDMGFYNVLGNADGYAATKEQLAGFSPEYIFYSDALSEEEVRNHFKKSKAVTDDRLYAVDMTAFATSSPRLFLTQFALAQQLFGEENIAMPDVAMEQPPYVPQKKSLLQKLLGQ